MNFCEDHYQVMSQKKNKMTLSSSEKKEKEIRMKDERMKNKRALAWSNATYAFSDPDIGAVFWNRKLICLIGRAKSLRVEQGGKKTEKSSVWLHSGGCFQQHACIYMGFNQPNVFKISSASAPSD